MSYDFRKHCEENEIDFSNARRAIQRDILSQFRAKQYWRHDINPDTGEPYLDDDGNPVMVPVDPIVAKQSFKDQTDINKILQRHQIKGATSHAVLFPPEAYQEFQNIDLLEAHAQMDRAYEIFDALPSEIRDEFGNDAFAFIRFASAPENNSRLNELLPAIAQPDSYFPNPVKRGGDGAAAATAPSDETAGGQPAEAGSPVQGDPAPPQGGDASSST